MTTRQCPRFFADYVTPCKSSTDLSERLYKGQANEFVITFSLRRLSFCQSSAFHTYIYHLFRGYFVSMPSLHHLHAPRPTPVSNSIPSRCSSADHWSPTTHATASTQSGFVEPLTAPIVALAPPTTPLFQASPMDVDLLAHYRTIAAVVINISLYT
jgi:hypothetical protein